MVCKRQCKRPLDSRKCFRLVQKLVLGDLQFLVSLALPSSRIPCFHQDAISVLGLSKLGRTSGFGRINFGRRSKVTLFLLCHFLLLGLVWCSRHVTLFVFTCCMLSFLLGLGLLLLLLLLIFLLLLLALLRGSCRVLFSDKSIQSHSSEKELPYCIIFDFAPLFFQYLTNSSFG